jgi:hypothetical protein
MSAAELAEGAQSKRPWDSGARSGPTLQQLIYLRLSTYGQFLFGLHVHRQPCGFCRSVAKGPSYCEDLSATPSQERILWPGITRGGSHFFGQSIQNGFFAPGVRPDSNSRGRISNRLWRKRNSPFALQAELIISMAYSVWSCGGYLR